MEVGFIEANCIFVYFRHVVSPNVVGRHIVVHRRFFDGALICIWHNLQVFQGLT